MASWKQGTSGNPNGRPSNEKSFTYALRQALCVNKFDVNYSNGETLSDTPRDIVAEYIAQAMVTGEVELRNHKKMTLSPKDWWEVIWQAINRVDGAPVQQLDTSLRVEQIVFDAMRTLPEPVDVEPVEIEDKQDEVV